MGCRMGPFCIVHPKPQHRTSRRSPHCQGDKGQLSMSPWASGSPGGDRELNLPREPLSATSPHVLVLWGIQHLELLRQTDLWLRGMGIPICYCIRKVLTISVYINLVEHHVCELLGCHRVVAPVDSSNSLEGKEDTGDNC